MKLYIIEKSLYFDDGTWINVVISFTVGDYLKFKLKSKGYML